MLLERNDVNLDISDHDDQTVDWWAAHKVDRIAKLLRGRGDFTPGYAASPHPIASCPPKPPPESSEIPSKRIRRF